MANPLITNLSRYIQGHVTLSIWKWEVYALNLQILVRAPHLLQLSNTFECLRPSLCFTINYNL
jgi:hypothetical protein